MKLYWATHTCAIGIHVVLEEIGQPYELEQLDFKAKEEDGPAFKSINPKGKVPTLIRDDGSVLTEYVNIAGWLAGTFKDADLLPFEDIDRQSRMYEAMEYAVGTVHGKAYHHIFKPGDFTMGATDTEAAEAKVKAKGVKLVEQGFAILGEAIGAGPWVVGDHYTIGDSAIFYTARWAASAGVTLPANVQAHLDRMKARPAVQRVMKVWGES